MAGTETARGSEYEYGTAEQLHLEPGDIVLISGAPTKGTTQSTWGDPEAHGEVIVARITQVPSSHNYHSTHYEPLAVLPLGERARRNKPPEIPSPGFRGFTVLRRGNEQLAIGTSMTYTPSSLDGQLQLTIVETQTQNHNLFVITGYQRVLPQVAPASGHIIA